ncbi:MAG TPA: FHA domain-containing protein, partial [Myxococcales bacterium]|nr:FHA domain-containing protein [Myxococcales bacterium]
MALLVVNADGAAPAFVPLVKPLTTVAAAPDSDVRVPDLRGVVAIQFDGESFTATALEGAQLLVNGKKRGHHILVDGDTLQLGATQLVFQRGDRVPQAAPAGAQAPRGGTRDPEALATSRLAQFARQLASEPGLDSALTRLLDALIEVVRADKGFVLEVTDGVPHILKARNFQRENVADAVESLSDTIVKRVLETREP